MAGGDKLRIAPGQLRTQLLQSFAEEPRERGGGKKRGRGHGRGKGRLPTRSQSPPPSATSVSATSPLQTRVSPVRDPPVQERTPMQDPPVQEPTPSHEEWGSWGDGEGAVADAEAEVEVEDEGAEAEDEGPCQQVGLPTWYDTSSRPIGVAAQGVDFARWREVS